MDKQKKLKTLISDLRKERILGWELWDAHTEWVDDSRVKVRFSRLYTDPDYQDSGWINYGIKEYSKTLTLPINIGSGKFSLINPDRCIYETEISIFNRKKKVKKWKMLKYRRENLLN
jgi:hypothetical protein